MKRFAAVITLTVVTTLGALPAAGQFRSLAESQRQSQKMYKKQAKLQAKAQKKYDKAQRKANAKANKQNHASGLLP